MPVVAERTVIKSLSICLSGRWARFHVLPKGLAVASRMATSSSSERSRAVGQKGIATDLRSWSGAQTWDLAMKPGRKPSGGAIGSENADVSSDKGCERHPRRKSKGSCLKLI